MGINPWELLNASLLGFAVGISGTLIGGLLILYHFSRKATAQSWLLGLSGGIMAAVVLWDLWPEALHFGGIIPTVLGSIAGMVLVQYFDGFLKLIPWYRNHQLSKLVRVGIMLGVGIGVHNFPEGVALGTTYIADPEIGNWLSLALLMGLHNIPEGMVMSAAFRLGEVNPFHIFFSLLLVEVPMAMGATVGALLGEISPGMVAFSLGFAGGAMIFLVGKELLPTARKLAGFVWTGCGFAVGILIGILLIRLT